MVLRGAARDAFALVAFAVVSACSLADFSGFSDGDDAVPDAGSLDGTAPSSDGGVDDSSVPATNDGGADATADADPKFCARNADAGFFCEDFEGVSPLLHFASTVTTNGTLVVDNGTMVADAPANADASEVSGVIAANVTGSRAHLEFSVRPEQLNLTTAHASQIARFLIYATKDYEIGIGVKGNDGSAVYTYEYTPGYYKEFGDMPPLAANAYTRFALDVRIDGSAAMPPRLDVDRDAVRVVDGAMLTPPFSQGTIEAYVGIPYTQAGHGAWRFRFDEILMRIP